MLLANFCDKKRLRPNVITISNSSEFIKNNLAKMVKRGKFYSSHFFIRLRNKYVRLNYSSFCISSVRLNTMGP